MLRDQVQIVQSTFALVRDDADRVAELFYTRLFQIAPDVRPLFRGDLKSQGRKLMSALALAVDGLTRLAELEPALEAMGRRHLQYGVSIDHYEAVGEALLATLKEGLGALFTPKAEEAWTEAYVTLAAAMQRGAQVAVA